MEIETLMLQYIDRQVLQIDHVRQKLAHIKDVYELFNDSEKDNINKTLIVLNKKLNYLKNKYTYIKNI